MKWKKLLILIISAEFLLGVSSCPSSSPPFNWHPDIFAHDSRTQSIERLQDGKPFIIFASDAEFDEFISIHKDEIAKAKQAYFDVVNQCEQWKSNVRPADIHHAMDWIDDVEARLREREQ